ncbi:MAG: VOC family protein [Phycisphaerae bacterium]
MAGQVQPIPEGFRTVTPQIVVKDGEAAIAFYRKAFGAEELCRMPGPDGRGVMHAEIKIGDSIIMLNDEFPGCGPRAPTSLSGSSSVVHLYVEDVDAVFDRAIQAGGKAIMPVSDTFWGDRYGMLTDPSGHFWSVSTHKEDLTPEQIGERAQAFFSKQGCQGEQ